MAPRKRLRQDVDDEAVAVESASASSSFQSDSVSLKLHPSIFGLKMSLFADI